VLLAIGRSHAARPWHAPAAALIALAGRVRRAAIDPFGRLLRSIERDALPVEQVGAARVRLRGADAGVAPDLSDFVSVHYPRLIRLAGLITRNTDDAQDAVQAALERAWKRRDDLRDGAALRPWLDRIVVREASRLSGSRVRRLVRLVTGTHDDDEVVFDVADPSLGQPGQLAEIGAAFAKLSTDQRAVVSLHLYAGYSVAETAAIVGAPVETVRSRLRLARRRLRDELERAG
jgi:RNA polymerase sigma-70 factor (ECF subfamily)